MIYRKYCDIVLYGNNEDFFKAVKQLEELGTIEAVEVLLKILFHDPKGLPNGDDLYRSYAIKPLIRLWKIAPEKIIPLIPIFCKYNLNDEGFVSIEDVLVKMRDEIGKEKLQKAFISGLNDYDYRVRVGTIYCSVFDHIIEDNLPLLVDDYKIETNVDAQNAIESILLDNINEEIAEMFFELLKNFRINLDDVTSITWKEEMYGTNEMLRKVTSIFLRKWKEEEDSTIRELIHSLVELLVSDSEWDVSKHLNKDEVNQLQEMGIGKN